MQIATGSLPPPATGTPLLQEQGPAGGGLGECRPLLVRGAGADLFDLDVRLEGSLGLLVCQRAICVTPLGPHGLRCQGDSLRDRLR